MTWLRGSQVKVTRPPQDTFGMPTSTLEHGEVECRIKPLATYSFRMALACLAGIRQPRFLRGPISQREPRSRNQNLPWTSRNRPVIRREHLSTARSPGESNPRYINRTLLFANATLGGPRRVRTRRVDQETNIRPGQAGAWLPKLGAGSPKRLVDDGQAGRSS